jgi:hypothetical protein
MALAVAERVAMEQPAAWRKRAEPVEVIREWLPA